LKKRKNELISDVLDRFSREKENVVSEENVWIDRQEISEKLLSLMTDRDDNNLLVHSKFIMEGFRDLNSNLSFKEIKVYNDIDTSLEIRGNNQIGQTSIITLGLEEIIYYMSKYITIADPNILEYKA
jgi:hypothetical protein